MTLHLFLKYTSQAIKRAQQVKLLSMKSWSPEFHPQNSNQSGRDGGYILSWQYILLLTVTFAKGRDQQRASDMAPSPMFSQQHGGRLVTFNHFNYGGNIILSLLKYIFILFSPFFLIPSNTTYTGMVSPTLSCTVPQKSLIKKCSIEFHTGQFYGGLFLIMIPYSQICLCLSPVDKTKQQTM